MSHAEAVNIVCTIDNNYVQHCAVMLASLFDNNPKLKFKIFIVTDGISSQNQTKLTEFLDSCNHFFSLITVDESIFINAPVSQHISIAAYFRILIPELIDSNIDKVLFLDSDMVICRSITPFWNIDISQYSHAAVENPCTAADYKSNLGMSEDSFYFNSGVLLINLQMWRQLNVLQKSLEFINQYPEKIHYWDQDALNSVLENQWLKVESEWNAHTAFFKTSNYEELGITSREYHQTRYNPAIIHFTGGGSCKPWHYNCTHPFKGVYYKYLSQTPWRDAQLISKPNLLSRFKAKTKALIKKRS